MSESKISITLGGVGEHGVLSNRVLLFFFFFFLSLHWWAIFPRTKAKGFYVYFLSPCFFFLFQRFHVFSIPVHVYIIARMSRVASFAVMNPT